MSIQKVPMRDVIINSITSSQIQDKTILTDDISDGTITGDNIAIKTITGNNIADGTISADKLNFAITNSGIISAGSITNTQIAKNTITADKLANGSITSAQIGAYTISGTNIAANTITSINIANGTITADKIANNGIYGNKIAIGTITGSNIANTTISGANILNNTITNTQIAKNTIAGDNIAIYTILGNNIAYNTITNNNLANASISYLNIMDNTIVNKNISNTAGIDTQKIDWNTLTQVEAVKQVTKQNEGLYFQNYDLESATTFVNPISSTTAFMQNIYLPFPMTTSYFSYVITTGNANFKSRIALWDSNYNLIWDSKDQSAAAGTYRLNIPTTFLLPGVYYIAIMCNSNSIKLLSQQAPAYSILPQRGTMTVLWGNFPQILSPGAIITAATKQPWFMLSKY